MSILAAENTVAEAPGFQMILIRCKWCNRPQMEVSENTVAIIRWKCKSCRNWNAFECSQGDDGSKLKIKYVGVQGRERREATR